MRGFFFAIALAHCGCAPLARLATEEPKPLSYVGRIEFGEPAEEDGRVVVPLAYSGGEWHRNSAIVPSSVDGAVIGGTIELTLLASVPAGSCEAGYRLDLPGGTQGTYEIYYRDPDGTRHEIGKLEIAE